jgi:hypothetical protein
VGVHIDELLVGVGDAHDDRLVGAQAAVRSAAHVKARLWWSSACTVGRAVISSTEAGTFSAISAAIHRQTRPSRDNGQLFCCGEFTPELKKVNGTAAATLTSMTTAAVW